MPAQVHLATQKFLLPLALALPFLFPSPKAMARPVTLVRTLQAKIPESHGRAPLHRSSK